MISLNATLKMSFYNPATFFGVHVTSTPMDLMYYQLVVASGQVNDASVNSLNVEIASTFNDVGIKLSNVAFIFIFAGKAVLSVQENPSHYICSVAGQESSSLWRWC
jgi:hypothetical protein